MPKSFFAMAAVACLVSGPATAQSMTVVAQSLGDYTFKKDGEEPLSIDEQRFAGTIRSVCEHERFDTALLRRDCYYGQLQQVQLKGHMKNVFFSISH